MYYDIKETELDDYGQNKNILFHIKDIDIMNVCGFRHLTSTKEWYFCESMGENISINITISDDNEKGKIDVLDDLFFQPYDFQEFIMRLKNNAPKKALYVQKELYQIMDSFKTFGIIEGWEWGDYI